MRPSHLHLVRDVAPTDPVAVRERVERRDWCALLENAADEAEGRKGPVTLQPWAARQIALFLRLGTVA